MTEDYKLVKKVIEWPFHKKIAHKVTNMHELDKSRGIVDPFHWAQDMTQT
jgi:hypothetical protein